MSETKTGWEKKEPYLFFFYCLSWCDSVAYALHGATTKKVHSESEPTPSLARRAGGYACCSTLVGCFRDHWLTGCFILTVPVSFLLADLFLLAVLSF